MSVRQSPAFAASMSFLVPGLGQISLGGVRRGVLLALPAVAVLVAAVGLWLGGRGPLTDLLLREDVLVGLLILNLVLAGYHVIAIVDAYGRARGARSDHAGARRASVAVLAAVLVLTFSVHGALEAVGYEAYATFGRVFVPADPGSDWAIPESSFEPSSSPSASPTPSPTPSPSGSPIAVPSASVRPTASPSPSPSPPPRWAADG
ncbi:MAG TPA: hypothetical protein VK194_01360, partial [Candidatus Deferrimicrobium sp.]|nr:hypothetical protein [Candidatus Deferrimicrobium sp.]